ncbi:hypothetical protein EU527_17555 [Candidatus Thorarchaeota archaeon]|nr:MAG: hypothetical protein EU527_17555 [Candidatus Thorarchaeota archaeon]
MNEKRSMRWNYDDLERFLRGQIKTEGILKKRPLETLEKYKTLKRPFRAVITRSTGISVDYQKESRSFIDEELITIVEDPDQRMLLWRPNYANLNITNQDELVIDEQSQSDIQEIQRMIDDILELRWSIQLLDDEMRPRLKRIQADPLSTIAFILPRAPRSRKHEKELLDQTRESHAHILASSLVTNTTLKDIITSAEIGNRVFIDTVVATYRAMDDSLRILVLEFPTDCTFLEAVKNGRALTRLCTINSHCRQRVENA